MEVPSKEDSIKDLKYLTKVTKEFRKTFVKYQAKYKPYEGTEVQEYGEDVRVAKQLKKLTKQLRKIGL